MTYIQKDEERSQNSRKKVDKRDLSCHIYIHFEFSFSKLCFCCFYSFDLL